MTDDQTDKATVGEDEDSLGGYTFEVVEEIPMGQPRRSRLEDVINRVRAMEPKTAILLKKFEKASTATASANNFKIRWGTKPDAYGFSFKTRRLKDNQYGLFVVYDPELIVDGAQVEVDKKYQEFREKTAEKSKKRDLEKEQERGAASEKATTTRNKPIK